MPKVECYACHAPSEPLQLWSYDVPDGTPKGFVDVAITHCGICHSDLHQINDAWHAACFPLVPGHEIVGHIVSVGEEVPEHLKVGARVGIGPQRSNCKNCPPCKSKNENLCPSKTKTYAGPGKDFGGFAKFIRYPADWAFIIPEALSSEEAAPLLCAGTCVLFSRLVITVFLRLAVTILASNVIHCLNDLTYSSNVRVSVASL